MSVLINLHLNNQRRPNVSTYWSVIDTIEVIISSWRYISPMAEIFVIIIIFKLCLTVRCARHEGWRIFRPSAKRDVLKNEVRR